MSSHWMLAIPEVGGGVAQSMRPGDSHHLMQFLAALSATTPGASVPVLRAIWVACYSIHYITSMKDEVILCFKKNYSFACARS